MVNCVRAPGHEDELIRSRILKIIYHVMYNGDSNANFELDSDVFRLQMSKILYLMNKQKIHLDRWFNEAISDWKC